MVFTIEYSNDACLDVQVRHVRCPGSRYQNHRWFAYALGDEIALTIAYIFVKLFTRTCVRVRISLKISHLWPISPTRSLRPLVSEELYSYGGSFTVVVVTYMNSRGIKLLSWSGATFPTLLCSLCLQNLWWLCMIEGIFLDGFQYYSIETNYSISAKTQNYVDSEKAK